MISIRLEGPENYVAVRRVNERAFGRTNEADLVDALRQVARPQVSLIAAEGGLVVGHIFFSPVVIDSSRNGALDRDDSAAMALGPMAVLPEYQRRGVGSRLVRRGLLECERLGHHVVVVLGHPRFYPRFGFSPAKPRGLHCEFPVPDEVFMVAELSVGALAGRAGVVKYRPEFARV